MSIFLILKLTLNTNLFEHVVFWRRVDRTSSKNELKNHLSFVKVSEPDNQILN